MNYLDYIILFVLLIGFVLGFKDGLVRKLIGLIGLILAVILVIEFSVPAGAYFAPFFNDEVYLAEIIAGVVIFFITILVVSIIKRVVHPVDKVNKFVNQILGGISGTIQIVFILSAFFMFLNVLRVPSEEAKEESLGYRHIYNVIPFCVEFFLGDDSNTQEYIKDFLEGNKRRILPDSVNDSTKLIQIDTNDTK